MVINVLKICAKKKSGPALKYPAFYYRNG